MPLREKNYYGIASDGLLFNCINDNSGIVFDFPYNCEYLYIETTKNISVQFGFCTENATLPTIMSAGTGRNSYKNINTVGNHYFKNSGLNNTCYVAGATNAQITKVFALVRYE